ncbi:MULTISPECIES: hypothetical protein [unclassified Bradyrhizobium]|uniref:hypothetical protein n=1 Tax=unclassified Bradyrhizobium TaxID=2631580 RepID=UPI002916F616|nr:MULTISPECIES: hypothetical protein [unclassified Bradyrhizobium]
MLFTDTRVTGQIPALGPYAFLNTIADAGAIPGRSLRPAVVMRTAHHHEPNIYPEFSWPVSGDFHHYHGGDHWDEMAALASLFLGIRLKAGDVNRVFQGEGDRFGRPTQRGRKPDPQLMPEGRPQIPRLKVPVNLNAGLEPLNSFPDRSVEQTNALIKAARQYQQAIWIADSDPSLAWLMLVSAIETAASEWASALSPVEQFETAFPDLVKLITESKAPDLLQPVANRLKNLTGSTKRFVNFFEAFAPLPPANRPQPYLQVSFAPGDLQKAVKLIYDHRSKSLHGGTAFPLPMCELPEYIWANDTLSSVQERPPGLGTLAMNASWPAEQTPMLLNTFEHIARGALLNWWISLDQPVASQP